MRNLLVILVMAAIGIHVWQTTQRHRVGIPEPVRAAEPVISGNDTAQEFHCEGKQHCSQMTSCAEAKFYLQNCPNLKIDGDHDGIPCEEQFCGHSGDGRL